MYPMAMPPQYSGSHQPIIHSSLYAAPLSSPGSYSSGPSISLSNRQSLNHGRQYDMRPNTTSFYINPQLANNDFALQRTSVTQRGNSSNAGTVNVHSNIHGNIVNHERSFDSHTASSRPKPFYGSIKQTSLNEELLQEMTKMHLGYIETEDSPNKMEQRQKLEDKILNFLSITPHQSKFAFPEVLEILENSVTMRSKFNAHKTACAFDALAQYASNLISQPWRKEFRELKLYSGFWVHQISNHLVGAETIIELMGYLPRYSKQQKNLFYNSAMPSRYVHSGVIDPDLISRLALDCMIAYCECQCLNRIREGLETFDFGFNQILEFRQLYMGDVDSSVRHLLYNLKQNLQFSKQSEVHRTKQVSSSPPPLPSRHTGHALQDRPSLKSPSVSSANKHFAIPSSSDRHRMSPDKSNKNHSRGYPIHDCFRSERWDRGLPEDNTSAVPTAILINLDTSLDGSSRGRRLFPKVVNRKPKPMRQDSDEVDFRPSQHLCPEVLKPATLEEHVEASRNILTNSTASRGDLFRNPSLELWDYVFQDLEKQGYNKDIGDRGDILNQLKQNVGDGEPNGPRPFNGLNNRKDKHKPMPLNQALQQLTLNESNDKLDGKSLSSRGSGIEKHGVSKRISIYDNLSRFDQSPEEDHNNRPALIKKMNNAARENKIETREPTEYVERAKRSRQEHLPPTCVTDRTGDGVVPWSCVACTYSNERLGKACEMCGKSRYFRRFDTPLESGSKECSECTLINEKGDHFCSACERPLDSCSTNI